MCENEEVIRVPPVDNDKKKYIYVCMDGWMDGGRKYYISFILQNINEVLSLY